MQYFIDKNHWFGNLEIIYKKKITLENAINILNDMESESGIALTLFANIDDKTKLGNLFKESDNIDVYDWIYFRPSAPKD